ncbi:MAG: hypothetical protein HND47_24750 [Chloroflexi bacterium]|nr:hypothetical protein [Chloroflexota bacterium]
MPWAADLVKRRSDGSREPVALGFKVKSGMNFGGDSPKLPNINRSNQIHSQEVKMISGVQVDAWSAFVAERGDLIEPLRQGVIQEVTDRKLQGLSITQGGLSMSGKTVSMFGEGREYLFFKQNLENSSANAVVALRMALRGASDLEISWRLIESNPAKTVVMGMSQGAAVLLGIWIALCIGLPLIPIGVGVFIIGFGVWLMGIGLGWWKYSQNKSRLTTEQMLDSRVLAQTVDYCLMKQLEKLGVAANELRILQAAQMEGIGTIAQTKIL